MEWLTLTLATVIGILGIRYIFFRKLDKLQRLGILHEKPWPILGNSAPIIFKRNSMSETVDRIYKLYENADYVGFYNFTEPIIMLRSPELIKSVAIKNFDHFVDHYAFVDPKLDPLFGKNLFGLRGEKWREVRNVLSPAFTSSKMKAMFTLMSSCAKNFTNYMLELSDDKLNVLNTKESFTRYTNDVIATCAFGISVDSMKNPNNDFYVLGREATNLESLRAQLFFLLTNFPRISKLLKLTLVKESTGKFFESIVRETMDTRDREGITRPDMIQLMMESRSKLTTQEMTAQAFGFFFGGFDSTSTTMCFTAYGIAANEDVQKKLQEEVDEVMEKTNGELTYEALNEMQYLEAVINESLRLYTVVPFVDRVCVKKFELPPALPNAKPVTIEPGQVVWLPAHSLQRDPKYFSDPDVFDPDRFIGDRKKNIDPSTYFPFGQGPRMCLGNRFAMMEIKVLFFYLLSEFHLKPSSKTIVPLRISKTSLAMTAEGGFWLQFKRRNNSAKKVI